MGEAPDPQPDPTAAGILSEVRVHGSLMLTPAMIISVAALLKEGLIAVEDGLDGEMYAVLPTR